MTAQWKQHAQKMLTGNRWLLAGILILFVVLNGIPQSFAPTIDAESMEPLTSIEMTLSFLSFLLTLLIAPLTVGWSWLVLSVSRGDKPAVSKLFEPFQTGYVKHVLAPFFVGLFIFLWALLLVIPGIVKAFSYSLTNYILRDQPELSALEAITESRRMMDGHKMDAFKLVLSFIGWFFVGVFTLGIGFLYVYPYFSTTYAAFYDSLRGADQPRTNHVGTPDMEQGF
ncbi:DUF975 family protein [Exiguobacterium sp. SH0S1]|uniref:DUF975 family protein n=1 Tax=Exiguobacterium sp. SH0S1 TaxID=2510949 RepID=UPI00103C90F0|nr:DUF975 family protein [Exiguobacterium sp. SH0S1]TCI80878.1 DUF975 family protein [Exiguobacterium sp. SH0S1]